ncbi:signal transduction histidine kinase [Oxalobacteraceae bacterium GrIS 1.11]
MSAISINTHDLPVDPLVLRKWQEVLDLLANIVKVPAALIMRVEAPCIKVFLSSQTDGNPYEEHETVPLGTGLYCETVMSTREQLIVPNALAEPHWRDNPDIALGMISYLGLPLVWPDKNVFGTICVLDRQENHYTPTILRLIQQFRGIVERDLTHIYHGAVREQEEAAIRADEAERVRRECMAIRASEEKALLALKESEQRWHFALEGAGDGVWDWNITQDKVFYSKRCLELLGFPEHTSVFALAEWKKCLHPDDLDTVMAEVQAYLDGAIPSFVNEHRFRFGDGWKWLLARGMVVARDAAGRPLRMTGTYSDITARKLAEVELLALNKHLDERVASRTAELQQAMEQIVVTEKMASLGRLVAGIAHELNTPLGNIILSSSTLKDLIEDIARRAGARKLTASGLDEFLHNGKDACELIERNSTHAGDLINSFKQVAVDQAGQQRRSFDLCKIVKDMVAALGPITRRARVAIEVRIPSGIMMDSYPGSLEQIITNLVTNSIHHGFDHEHGGRIVIDGRLRSDTVELSYEDDGRGIDKHLHDKVFEPFFTTKMGQGGSGLGLAIVHNIVHAIVKGSVRLESEPGRGVRFLFCLPRVLA